VTGTFGGIAGKTCLDKEVQSHRVEARAVLLQHNSLVMIQR